MDGGIHNIPTTVLLFLVLADELSYYSSPNDKSFPSTPNYKTCYTLQLGCCKMNLEK